MRRRAAHQRRAVEYLNNVYRDPAVGFVEEPAATRARWLQLAGVPRASPNVWMDAYLSAFAISLSAELVTFDGAFAHDAADGVRVRLLQGG